MRRVIVVGIDPSSKKLAMVLTPLDDSSDIVMRTFRLAERDKKRACTQAYDAMDEIVNEYRNADLRVFLELPVLGRGGAGATIPQARINGAVTTCCGHNDVNLTDTNNQSWKSVAIGGKGRIDKTRIAAGILQVWPAAFEMADGDQDLLDAAGINIYGRTVVQKAEAIREHGILHRPRIRRKAVTP